jgi:hypothetical protein
MEFELPNRQIPGEKYKLVGIGTMMIIIIIIIIIAIILAAKISISNFLYYMRTIVLREIKCK